MEKEKKTEQPKKETSDPRLESSSSQFYKTSKGKFQMRKYGLLVAFISIALAIGVVVSENAGPKSYDLGTAASISDSQYELFSVYKRNVLEYNEAVKNYNTVAEEYRKVKEITSLENIDNLPETNEPKVYLDENIEFSDFAKNDTSRTTIVQDIEQIREETDELLYALILAQQITNPDEEWVIERLKVVDDIIDVQAVTKRHDPNQLLNSEGGYTSCLYFSVKGINQSSVRGIGTIDKGTDAGGAVEVYKTVADAQNRCNYLGQFDNTLLYSGSYAIVGTTVIRTSYLLTNEQQIELTNKITESFTTLK